MEVEKIAKQSQVEAFPLSLAKSSQRLELGPKHPTSSSDLGLSSNGRKRTVATLITGFATLP